MKDSLLESLKTEWKNLDRNIYVGERLESNLRALTFVSVVSALLGLTLLVVDIITKNLPLIIPSVATLLAGVGCAFCAHVLKNRKLAVLFPAVFCASFLTAYILTGVGEGSSILWSLLAPIGLCYFVSVKFGILFSAYYTILSAVVLYSPLSSRFSAYYPEDFLRRFPILFATLSIFTGMAMMQYHSKALFEIDHANSLMEEVERQTAVVKEQSRKIEQMSYETILTLANAIDAKDPYTKGHSTRVSQYSACLAESLGWDKEKVNDLRFAALLHDIGKIGVPDSILNNPKSLTDVERDIIRSHTTIGKDMLKDKVMVDFADEVAGCHHERFDGTGYPSGLKGGDIPMEARIVAIADSFDAMSSDRVYRKACEPEHIRSELKEGKGTQFDPYLTDLFINLWDQGKLNDILNVDSNEDGEAVEASSVILKVVVETFVTQGSKDEIDITTGIMSRNAGESIIARDMKEEAGCLIFMDVDNLKKINDTFGHDAGDRVLRLMGDTLTANSSNSLCCRLGGDEFLLFIKKATTEEAEKRVKKIIRDFEENKKADPAICISSISAGLVMCTPEDSYTDAYNKADKALYHVKQNGKSDYYFYNDKSEASLNNEIDIEKLVNSIRNSGSYNGAMNVEYREFTKLYEFVTNLKQRFSYSFKLIMITLDDADNPAVGAAELERAMFNMELSIRQTIRDVDVLTRYNRNQFLVILLGADNDGIKIAIDRIFRGFFKIHGSGDLMPTYSVADFEGEPVETH